MDQQQFQALQKEQEQSGLSESGFCKANGISPSTFGYWKRKSKTLARSTPEFLEISTSNPSPFATIPFECQLANGRVLRIPQKFDMSSLKLILSILDS